MSFFEDKAVKKDSVATNFGKKINIEVSIKGVQKGAFKFVLVGKSKNYTLKPTSTYANNYLITLFSSKKNILIQVRDINDRILTKREFEGNYNYNWTISITE